MQGHTIICGFGVKGLAAAETVLAHGTEPEGVVIIDPRAEAIDEARRRGFAGVVGDASNSFVLRAAGVVDAAAVIVAPDRDDTAVLITLTARELNHDATIVAAVRDDGERPPARTGRRRLRDRVLGRGRPAARPGGPQPAHRARARGPAERGVGPGRDRERDHAEQAGPLSAYPSSAPVIAVVRDGEVLRFDDPRAAQLRPATAWSASARTDAAGSRQPHVQVVVVVGEHLHHPARPAQAEARAGEHVARARGHEAVDEILGEPPVDASAARRLPLPAVAARVVDVRVEAVLVRDVAEAAELLPERPAVWP